jgi:CDP-glycerol glycerophosphotransferase (TagB/SpsB family)
MGLKVLEYFFHHQDFNLIFAPHVVLFKRKKRHAAFLPSKYRRAPNIYIDLGSSASIDMTYTQIADIYLGDVSSQVYEFLLTPRPCIFLNGHQVDWQSNGSYQHWSFGQVVENIELEFGKALKHAFTSHTQYINKQRDAFAYTFYSNPETTAAERGAIAIADFLKSRSNRECICSPARQDGNVSRE